MSVDSITILFSGSLDNFKNDNFDLQKSSIVHNQLELISEPIIISADTSAFGFELVLPRTLPSSVNSKLFKLNYILTAHILFNDSSKLTRELPVRVYNTHLSPHHETHQFHYKNSGTVLDLLDWEIQFPSRLFNLGDNANFKFNLKSKKGVIASIVTVKLLQKTLTYQNSSGVNRNSEDDELRSINQVISQDSFYTENKRSERTLNISLPISEKSSTIPTIDTQDFAVSHRIHIQIQFDYTELKTYNTKITNLAIPIGIASDLSKFKGSELLPNYNNLTSNSKYLAANELLPIYSRV
ncbi:hypothetical protein CONCODRAFT_170554 [Conidiobolus coronatus NRRL 28638]|uniref:Arrestin C-terminal-like domain-containing protein n=1 Tax=Conidiobolus coronatus (strain ATCC 28846 / CBS 209.66 / NRRL 28638) TaxID=796925 RepID=A0A137PH54_CONC2|nr:hypothetical protein CONCODRAFT_170554 [Conidiobolus coronatus NRRL 28638]|eukprot:KXN74318.1 hypothetical protein CONCODRAFT_170554 [Conidiobolus coronatus NRRL 28638]